MFSPFKFKFTVYLFYLCILAVLLCNNCPNLSRTTVEYPVFTVNLSLEKIDHTLFYTHRCHDNFIVNQATFLPLIPTIAPYEFGTNSRFTYIFKEHVPLMFFTNECVGLHSSTVVFMFSRLVFLFAYIGCACFKFHGSLSLCYRYKRLGMSRKQSYLVRKCLASARYTLKMQLQAALVLMLLILLCGDIHPHPGPVTHCIRHPGAIPLVGGTWNVRTLLESKRSAARPTAIVSREMARYGIDFAALQETRILGESVIEEVEGGYTFFLKGKPEGDKHYYGVGFAIKSKLVKQLEGKYPIGINERLMTMCLPLQGCSLSIISAYAPTLAQSDEVKERFYGQLSDAIEAVPSSHKLLVLGDFNARVGTDFESWENVIGKHGVGRENSNGTLLLSLCSQHNLSITNTLFQQADRHKTTWMHPRTKGWHMIDYVITRQRDIQDVHHTRAMCGSCTWSDHRLVRAKLSLRPKIVRHIRRQKPAKKLDIAKLKSVETREMLGTKLQEAYAAADQNAGASTTHIWKTFKSTTLQVSEEVLGSPERKHRDWFDENDTLIKPLLTALHGKHLEAIEDKSNSTKATAYRECKQQAQKSLRTMQNNWWKDRATDLQQAADRRDYKSFYQGMKAVYGPRYKNSSAIKSKDGTVLTEPDQILGRWAEHFNGVLNQDSSFDRSVLEDIPQWDINTSLAELPTIEEIHLCIRQLNCGKAPGEDGIPPDIYVHGGVAIAEQLLIIFTRVWEDGEVPQDFKDATIVHLYKNKGDRMTCDNHRGIALLNIAGKIFARLLLNRLIKHADDIGVVPESQCGFRANRGTVDMSFALQQIQEKCKIQYQDLYLLFIDLTKAFDTVFREGLWCILEKVGCPKLFIDLIRSFHDGMHVTVREGSESSSAFTVTSGTKQGCVLAPTLFSIFFSLMLHVAFKDTTDGVDIHSRFDRGLCNLKSSHFKATSKIEKSTIRDLLFADDCALAACSLEALQRLCDSFSVAARRFGLVISIKKTEALYQPARGNDYIPPATFIEGKALKAVEQFKYLGSIVSNDASNDLEVTARIAKATASFGRLTKRLWANRNIRLDTKISVYKACVLTSLLFGCEAWTLTKKQIMRLEKFHLTCLRKIAKIRWYHKVTNYDVLTRCKVTSVQSMIDSARLRWTGHVVRMNNDRIPKKLLYGRLATGRSRPGNHNTYQNSVRSTLKRCDIPCGRLEKLASKRGSWRAIVKKGVAGAEVTRTEHLKEKRRRRKANADLAHVRA